MAKSFMIDNVRGCMIRTTTETVGPGEATDYNSGHVTVADVLQLALITRCSFTFQPMNADAERGLIAAPGLF